MPVLLTVLRGVRLDMHQHRNNLWMRTEDVGLDPARDGMAFGDRGAFGDLQVEIDLEAVAQPAGAESMEALGSRRGEDVLAEVVQHVRGRSGIEQVFAGAFEEFNTLRTQPAGEYEAHDLIEGLPFGINVGHDDRDQGEERSDGVGAVVSSVGHQQALAEALGLSARILVETFLDQQGAAGDPGGGETRLGDVGTADERGKRLPGQSKTEE